MTITLPTTLLTAPMMPLTQRNYQKPTQSPLLFGSSDHFESLPLNNVKAIRTDRTKAYLEGDTKALQRVNSSEEWINNTVSDYLERLTTPDRALKLLQYGDLLSSSRLIQRATPKTDTREQAAIRISLFKKTLQGDKGAEKALAEHTSQYPNLNSELQQALETILLNLPGDMRNIQNKIILHCSRRQDSLGQLQSKEYQSSSSVLNSCQPIINLLYERLIKSYSKQDAQALLFIGMTSATTRLKHILEKYPLGKPINADTACIQLFAFASLLFKVRDFGDQKAREILSQHSKDLVNLLAYQLPDRDIRKTLLKDLQTATLALAADTNVDIGAKPLSERVVLALGDQGLLLGPFIPTQLAQ